jgi:hypothetical protein
VIPFNFVLHCLVYACPFPIVCGFSCCNAVVCPHSLQLVDFEEICLFVEFFLQGVSVRVRRPSDYNPSMAATLGPSQPSPHLNLAAVGLTPGSAAGGTDGPDRVFVGGLPYYLTEVQIKELLESFGEFQRLWFLCLSGPCCYGCCYCCS